MVMKNIHILPTDKPSKLGQVHKKLSFFKDRTWDNTENWRCKHIYITSDVEIKFNDYITDGYKIWKWKDDSSLLGRKKIILTTDQDLIKDGVQTIDDEFLEWFVKNPSCENIDIKTENICGRCYSNDLNTCWSAKECSDGKFDKIKYKIIIPKEEPKQENCCTPVGKIKRYVDCKGCDRKPKQETLEEAADKATNYYTHPDIKKYHIESFIKGAKWQAKRMYSEEEVLVILDKFLTEMVKGNKTGLLEEWFKQFKKLTQ